MFFVLSRKILEKNGQYTLFVRQKSQNVYKAGCNVLADSGIISAKRITMDLNFRFSVGNSILQL